MLAVTIEQDTVRIGDRFAVTFQRTLRIPDDGRPYPLPPGLGRFPILQVEDYADRLPRAWIEKGGLLLPMHRREALWLGFHGTPWRPNAVKIAVGGINAVSGVQDDAMLPTAPQDYLVCPDQPWLDGIRTASGSIRQFVAMPLGLGYTIESSITGTEVTGGLQITVFEPKPGRFPGQAPTATAREPVRSAMPRSTAMGLGAGGTIRQKIYPDPYGVDPWDPDNYGRVLVHIIDAAAFFEITGREPPPTPIDAATYNQYGLPWFDLYDEAKGDVIPSGRLTGVKTIRQRDDELKNRHTEASFEVPDSRITRVGQKERGAQGSLPDDSDPAGDARKRE